MRKYTQKELRELVRLGLAEDYTNKPSDYIYTLRRLERWAIPPAFTVLTADLYRIGKPAHYMPLLDVVLICLSCFKKGIIKWK